MKLYSINTGYFKLDGGAMFGVVPKSMWDKINPADENNMCSWALRCLLVEDGNRLILIDNGMGDKQDAKFFGYYCVQDVVSAVFYARNIDFSKLNPEDKIAFSMFLDNEVYEMYIRYIGKETIKTKYGKFNAIKFKPLLIKGSIFEGGEKMTVWVTDDANHIPVRIESPIVVGKVKIDMVGFENIRHPLTSLIRKR